MKKCYINNKFIKCWLKDYSKQNGRCCEWKKCTLIIKYTL